MAKKILTVFVFTKENKMNITPVNNYCNNNNTSFKNIYKVQMKHSLFPHPDELTSAFDVFVSVYHKTLNMISTRRADEIKNLSKTIGFKDRLKSALNIRKENTVNICFDNAFYSNFQILKTNTGYSKGWLALHLKIDEPKPIKEGYHTYFVYTGEDAKAVSKFDKKGKRYELLQNAYIRAQEKLHNGEIEPYDYQYWTSMLHADEHDKAIRQKFANNKITTIEINNADDIENRLFPIIYKSMPIYGVQNL